MQERVSETGVLPKTSSNGTGGASLVLCGESAIQKKIGDRSIWSKPINSGKKAR
jgi:hypothetical protein